MDRAFIFDVFGTLVDWRSGVAEAVGGEVEPLGVDPFLFADHWRSRYQPAMERVRSGGRGYVPLDRLHRENLDETLAHFAVADRFDEPERDALNHAWERLPPWPDVLAGLDALRPHALLAPCSNGSIALMTRLARFAGLRWDAILGAEVARDYKPKPGVYLAACAALGLPPEQVTMVAAHNDDLAAARDAGLRTAFIARTSEHGPGQVGDLVPEGEWDRVVGTIGELADV